MAKFCENCGTQLDETATKCGSCGAEVKQYDAASSQTEGQGTSQSTSAGQTSGHTGNNDGTAYSWNSDKHVEIKRSDSIHPARIVLAVIFSFLTFINLTAFMGCIMGYGFTRNLNSDNVNAVCREFSAFVNNNVDSGNFDNGNGYYYDDPDDMFKDIFGDMFGEDNGYSGSDNHYGNVSFVNVNHNGHRFTGDDFRNMLNDLENYGSLSERDAAAFDGGMSAANTILVFAIVLFGVLTALTGLAIFLSLGVKMRYWLTSGIIFTVMGVWNAFVGFSIFAGGKVLYAASLYNTGSLVTSCGTLTLIASGAVTLLGIVLIVLGVVGRKKA